MNEDLFYGKNRSVEQFLWDHKIDCLWREYISHVSPRSLFDVKVADLGDEPVYMREIGRLIFEAAYRLGGLHAVKESRKN